MKIQVRLLGLLPPDLREKPLGRIATAMGLTAYDLKHLLDPTARMISKETLEVVCEYLVRNKRVAASELPGALFTITPHDFWKMIADRHLVFTVMGMRTAPRYHDQLVVVSDAMLQRMFYIVRVMGNIRPGK